MHHPDDGEAVLRFVVADRVAAGQEAAGRTHLGVGRGEDLGEHLHRQLFGEGRDRKREQRLAAHCEDVVQGVGRRDRSVVAGVVDHRREEIEREDQRALVVEAVNRRVVCGREPDQQVLGFRRDEARQELLEPRGRVLGGTASARGEIGQLD